MYAKWYVIAWRLLWCPLVYAGGALMLTGLCLGWGRDTAAEVRRDIFG